MSTIPPYSNTKNLLNSHLKNNPTILNSPIIKLYTNSITNNFRPNRDNLFHNSIIYFSQYHTLYHLLHKKRPIYKTILYPYYTIYLINKLLNLYPPHDGPPPRMRWIRHYILDRKSVV